MGLSNPTSTGNRNLVSVVGGKWTMRVPEGTPNSVKRINKKDVEVNELHFSNADGVMRSMAYKDTPFGRVVEIPLVDEAGEESVISFTTNDQHLMTLCKMIPNIDLNMPVELVLVLDQEKTKNKGKDCHALLVKQNDEWVHHYYKKDTNGLPAFKKRRDGSWDSSEHDDFLLGVLEDAFSGKMEAPTAEAVVQDAGFVAEEDDVPF